VAVAGGAGEDADDDLRAKAAHDAHGVLVEGVFGPLAKRFFLGAREAEVVGAGEVLPRAVEAARRRELLRAHEPEPDSQIRANQILTALAAGQREVCGLSAQRPRDVSQDLRVFVVGVRTDDEKPPVRCQLLEQPIDFFETSGRRRLERVADGGRRRFLGPERRARQEQGERRADDPRRPTHAITS
jgi:hypothetical protein